MPSSDKRPEELAEELLQFINPDMARNEWANIGMALKYELGEDVAHQLFRNWSQQSKKFSESDFTDTWKSIRPGSFKMGTLVHYAKQEGWTGEIPRLSHEEQLKRDAQRQQEVEAANQKMEADRREARRLASYFWSKSNIPNLDHAYLVKKNITEPKGVKEFTAKNGARYIQVPCFNKEGVLMSLQSIGENGYKGFQKGAQVTGGSMSIGKNKQNANLPVIICEGWATGMSLNKASGLQVVVAFNSANLGNIVSNVRAAYPNRSIIIAADNDFENKGGNVGYTKSLQAAERIGNTNVAVILPEFSTEEIDAFKAKFDGAAPTDFNDIDVFLGDEILKNQVLKQIENNLEFVQSNELSL